MLLTACPTQTTLVIPPNQPSMSRGDEQNDGSTTRLSSRGKFASPSQEALSSYPIIRCILRHIEEDFLLLGRQRRQALISQLARVSKAWVKPVNQRLYRWAKLEPRIPFAHTDTLTCYDIPSGTPTLESQAVQSPYTIPYYHVQSAEISFKNLSSVKEAIQILRIGHHII